MEVVSVEYFSYVQFGLYNKDNEKIYKSNFSLIFLIR